MRPLTRFLTLSLCASTIISWAQPSQSTTVPKLVRFTGSFHPANGTAASTEGVTLAIYRDQTGGSPLWQEVQNVPVDSAGNYSLLLGATLNDGLPMDLFSSNEPRWLGVQFNRPGEIEQPRVLLASVPYALKSVDAETLGGKPASAYALAESAGSSSSSSSSSATPAVGSAGVVGSTASSAASASTTPSTLKPRVTGGTPGFLGVFVNSTDLGNSVVQQANGAVGVGTLPGAGAATMPSLDLRTNPFSQIGMSQTTDYLTFFSSDTFGPAIYWNPGKDLRFGKGGTGLYNAFGFTEQMRIQSSTGNMGIGTTTPVAKLDVAGDINWNGNLLFQGFPVLQLQNSLGSLGFGTETLRANNTAFFVTAVGNSALFSNTTGCCNTAVGSQVMASNTQGANNVAVGDSALSNSTIGNENTAVGSLALERNSSGSNNTAVGQQVLARNTTGGTNTAMGWAALSSNVSGGSNIAVGYAALGNNTTGNENIAIGSFAGNQISEINSNNIDIGSGGAFNDNGAIRIGDSLLQTSFFAAGIRGVTTTNNDALPVVIDSAGQLGTVSSSRRFKEDIQDMADSSRGLMQLRPVTFRYKQPYADGSKPTQYGLIAEEVAEVYPDLVARSADGQIESVKYQVLDSMLLNEVQRQQSEIRSQQSEIASQKSEIASEKSEIASQKSEIASQRELIQKLLERVTRLESARGESSNRDRAETQISLVATPHVR